MSLPINSPARLRIEVLIDGEDNTIFAEPREAERDGATIRMVSIAQHVGPMQDFTSSRAFRVAGPAAFAEAVVTPTTTPAI